MMYPSRNKRPKAISILVLLLILPGRLRILPSRGMFRPDHRLSTPIFSLSAPWVFSCLNRGSELDIRRMWRLKKP